MFWFIKNRFSLIAGLLLIAGTLFFGLSDSISAQEKRIELILLFWTFLVLFWYTFETHLLRKAAYKDDWGLLSVDEENSKRHTILYMPPDKVSPGPERRDIFISLFVKNIGRAPLKITQIFSVQNWVWDNGYSDISPKIEIDEDFLASYRNILLSVQDSYEIKLIVTVNTGFDGSFGLKLLVAYEDSLGHYTHGIRIEKADLRTGKLSILDNGKTYRGS